MLPTRHIALAGESCSVKQACVEQQVIHWPAAAIAIAFIALCAIIIIVVLNRRY